MAHSYDAEINAVVLPPRVEKLLKIERHHDSMAEKKKKKPVISPAGPAWSERMAAAGGVEE